MRRGSRRERRKLHVSLLVEGKIAPAMRSLGAGCGLCARKSEHGAQHGPERFQRITLETMRNVRACRADQTKVRLDDGFKSFRNATITRAGIELAHRIRQRQSQVPPAARRSPSFASVLLRAALHHPRTVTMRRHSGMYRSGDDIDEEHKI